MEYFLVKWQRTLMNQTHSRQAYLQTLMDHTPPTLSTISHCTQTWMPVWSPGNKRQSILNTFCHTNRQLSVVSTYVHGEAQTPLVGPIPWGHSGPLCHALSSSSSWTSMRRRRATRQKRHVVNGNAACGGSRWRMGPTFFKCFLLNLLSTYCINFTANPQQIEPMESLIAHSLQTPPFRWRPWPRKIVSQWFNILVT